MKNIYEKNNFFINFFTYLIFFNIQNILIKKTN